MSFSDDFNFRKQLERSPNLYAEIRNVANSARILSAEYDNKILHSEAITCVINGIEPDFSYIGDFEDEYIAHQIKETFCYIDDKEICNAVYDSFYKNKSKKNPKNLIFIYNNILEPERQARVRILTKMLWYRLIKMEV